MQGKKDRDVSKILHEVQPYDILKFGLIPELVGRLPVIASLDALRREDLVRILQEPKNALVKQYTRLFEMDGVELEFTDDALEAIADQAIHRGTGWKRFWRRIAPPGRSYFYTNKERVHDSHFHLGSDPALWLFDCDS